MNAGKAVTAIGRLYRETIRQTEEERKSLWLVTPEDERAFSLGVLQR